MNKKGLSPLIATVLLIAFAVALGAVVMNWTSTQLTPGDQPIIISQTQDSCTDVVLRIEQIGDKPSICITSDNKLKFMLENAGTVIIKSIKLTIIGSAGDPYNTEIPDSKIPPSEIKRFEVTVPGSVGSVVKLKLTPVTWGTERDAYCINQTVEATTINSC